ncbi:phosphatidylinositol-specific phospholipase C [Aquimarina hainanensis]
MDEMPGHMKLSGLSIPGTHDSGARYDSPYYSGTAKCQDLTIGEQLKQGTRFLDIRCRRINNRFTIHHGPVYQKINFTDVLDYCYDFLNKNPSETIIMSLKEEHTPSNSNMSFEAIFDSYINKNPTMWYLGKDIPILEIARGQIVLVRRFHAARTPKGIDANPSLWENNSSFFIFNGSQILRVQDEYEVSDTHQKWSDIIGLFSEALNDRNRHVMYINFTSGYSGLIPNIPSVANEINQELTSYFRHSPRGRYGSILMDFAEESKNRLIIDTNFINHKS